MVALADSYSISAVTSETAITDIQLEAIAEASLPGNDPGRASDSNFVVSEFAVTATPVPEPSVGALLAGMCALAVAGRWHHPA